MLDIFGENTLYILIAAAIAIFWKDEKGRSLVLKLLDGLMNRDSTNDKVKAPEKVITPQGEAATSFSPASRTNGLTVDSLDGVKMANSENAKIVGITLVNQDLASLKIENKNAPTPRE